MKKTLTVLLVLVICFASVFAYQNTYKLESKEVQSFLLLRRLTNTNTADPTYPISASQLADLVKSLDTSKLNDTSRAMYDNLLKEIEQPEVFFGKDGMGVDVDISLLGAQVMKSAEPNTYGILPFKDRMATAEIKATMYMKDYMTGVFDLASRTKLDYYKAGEKKLYLNTLVNFMKYSEGVPDYAYASIGFDDLNFVIGRDRLAAGNGKTGNLELGGNILDDNFAKLSFVGSFISYDFTLDSFERGDKNSGKGTDILDYKKNIYLHRVSFNFKDFLSFSAYEGALVHAVNPFNDIQFFNPFMFMHNTGSYYQATTNNFAGFEFSAVIPGHFQVDAQLLLDQLGGSDGYGENAFAALLNVSNTQTIGKGILDAYAEFVYGNPYVYLKNDHGFGMYEGFNGYANLDLVNDAKSDFNNGNDGRELQYLGYRYGGDLFSIGAGAAYLLDDAKFTLDLQFINKGSNGIWAGENRKASEPTGNNMKVIKAYAGYEQTFIDAVKVEARLGGAEYINYQHSGKNLFDPQFSIGVSIQPLEFIKNKKNL